MSNLKQTNYKNLGAWERAHHLTLRAYEISNRFPAEERFGLTAQVRRSAFSVGANIAEGSGRGSDKEFLRFLHIALGSLKETEYALLVAFDLGYLDKVTYDSVTSEVNQTFAALQGFIRKLSRDLQING